MDMQEVLSSLISNTTLDQKDLRRKIMSTLQLTNDFMTVKALTDKILGGDYDSLKAQDLENLVNALMPVYKNEDNVTEYNASEAKEEQIKNNNNEGFVNNDAYKIMLEENQKILNKMKKMKEELKLMSEQVEELKEDKNKLESENEKYRKMFKITDTHELVQVSDEEVNELYFLYKTEQKTEHKFAFIIDNKLVKSYYNIQEVK